MFIDVGLMRVAPYGVGCSWPTDIRILRVIQSIQRLSIFMFLTDATLWDLF